MAVVITKQPTGATVTVGKITQELSITATGAASTNGYVWKEAKSATDKTDAKTLATTDEGTWAIPTDLKEGTYYYYCSVTDGTTPVDSNIVAVQAILFPEYITGNWVHDYLKACGTEVNARFTKLCTLTGITIPKNDNVLRTAQVEVFMEAL